VPVSKKSPSFRTKTKPRVAEKKMPNLQQPATHTSESITVDRRSDDRRSAIDRRKQNVPVAVERRGIERRVKVSRRRQIDPTTCERDYTPDEIEFMAALDQYKRRNGRMFPTCSEVLEVVRSLGYEKAAPIDAMALPSFSLETTIVASLAPAIGKTPTPLFA
jgi:hypothetical protein